MDPEREESQLTVQDHGSDDGGREKEHGGCATEDRSGYEQRQEARRSATTEETAAAATINDQETSRILELAKQYKEQGEATTSLETLIAEAREVVENLAQAKGDKLMKTLVSIYLEMEQGTDPADKIRICKETIAWALGENRNYLRRALQLQLVGLYCEVEEWKSALKLGTAILPELKRLDDRDQLVEVQYLESCAYLALSNLPRARAALVAAKTTANSTYVPPNVQAKLDFQSGVLCAAESRDFKTAFSYFFEAYEEYKSIESPLASRALQYMILSKVMISAPEEINKFKLEAASMEEPGVAAMLALAQAAQDRSLAAYKQAVDTYRAHLITDPVIGDHLKELEEDMLEKNLNRIVEPYSRVHVDYVAHKIGLDRDLVELKLSQMILDRKLSGIMDQENGVLIIFTNTDQEDKLHQTAVELLAATSTMLDSLVTAGRRIH